MNNRLGEVKSDAEEVHLMAEPDFEFPPKGHSFDPGDEIYVIDENKVDLLLATITNKSSKRYEVRIEDGEDQSFKTPKRLLLRTATNNSIYENQRKIATPPPIPPSNPEEEEEAAPPPKRARKTKPVVLPADYIAKEAWKGGIHDPQSLRTFLAGRTDEAVHIYETRARLLGMADAPLFKLGGDLDAEVITNFWDRAKEEWTKMFGETISVKRDAFLKKITDAFRLPNQTTANARSALKFFFEGDQIGIPAFCAFLAQFGPKTTLMRKVGGYWKAPCAVLQVIKGANVSAIEDLTELANIEGNSFEAATVNGKKIVYNIVGVESDGEYLVDEEGKRYPSWEDFCEANPPESQEEEEEAEAGEKEE